MGFRVFLVDDDRSFTRLLELRLKNIFSELLLTSFDNLTDARDFLKTHQIEPFPLVILDQHLPDGTGINFLQEGWFEKSAVLVMSSDSAPEIPGASIKAGAAFFLSKFQTSEPLFRPLLEALVERNRLLLTLKEHELNAAKIETVRILVGTLRHEINNPLGAVLGAAYLLRTSSNASDDQKEAANLVEISGKRIQHVLQELCEACSLESMEKGKQKVFHIPGDKEWK